MTIQHLRSSTANKRPTPAAMSDGQLAVNTNTASPGLFFKDSAGALIKVGPVHVGTTAPNASPASGGETGNTVGEQWLDTTGGTYVFKVWDGSAWRSESGTFVDVNGDVMTGALGIIAGSAGSPGLYFSGDTNTGLYSPGADQVAISTGGTGRITIDGSGNVNIDSNTLYVDATNNRVGIGTASPSGLLHVSNTGTAGTTADNLSVFFSSANRNATVNIIAKNTESSILNLGDGDSSSVGRIVYEHASNYMAFDVNASECLRITSTGTVNIKGAGTAGSTQAVSFNGSAPVNSLVIDSSGRLLVGTSSARSNFFGTSYASALQVETASVNNPNGLSIGVNTNDDNPANLYLFKTRGTSVGSNTAVQNGDVLGSINFIGANGTDLSNTAAWIRCVVDGVPFSSGDTTDLPGALVFSTTPDSGSSPVERVRITNNGTLFVGKQSESFSTAGFNTGTGGTVCARTDLPVLYVSRISDDGTLVSFYQGGTEEGTISVSGTTVSYNGAHLSRWSQIPGIDPHDKDQRPEILRGTVMSNLDELCDWTCPESGDCQDNEQLNKTKISDVVGDKNVAGVFQSWDDDDDTWVNDYYLAMTGDFVIRIAAGVTVERGDLLMSAGDGTAKPQDDDIIRSKTVAKVTSTNVSCTYEDGSYCVPCVLMAC